MSYLNQVGLVVLCVQTSRDNVSGFPVYVTPHSKLTPAKTGGAFTDLSLYSTECRCLV